MENNKPRVRNVFKLLLALALLAALGLGLGVYRYTSNVPKLTPNNWLQDVASDNTFSWNNLYKIKCKGEYDVELSILDTNIPDAKITEDKSSVYVGRNSGYIHLLAVGHGRHSERGNESDIYLYTSYGADERPVITEKIKAASDAIDKAVHEQYFKGEEAELLRCAASLPAYNYPDKMEKIYPVYYTEYKNSRGDLVYLEIKSTIDLSGDSSEPYDIKVDEENLYDSTAGLVANFKNTFADENKMLAENLVISDELRNNRLSSDMIMKFNPEKLEGHEEWDEQTRIRMAQFHFINYIIDVK